MSTLLRLLSIACSLVLIVAFAMFASDQAGKGEKQTVAKIAAGDSTAVAQRPAQPAKKKHGPVRTGIERVNEKLVAPFSGVVPSHSPWTQHIAESLLAFLVFGLGLGFASRLALAQGL